MHDHRDDRLDVHISGELATELRHAIFVLGKRFVHVIESIAQHRRLLSCRRRLGWRTHSDHLVITVVELARVYAVDSLHSILCDEPVNSCSRRFRLRLGFDVLLPLPLANTDFAFTLHRFPSYKLMQLTWKEYAIANSNKFKPMNSMHVMNQTSIAVGYVNLLVLERIEVINEIITF